MGLWNGGASRDGYAKYYRKPEQQDEVSDYHRWLVNRGVTPSSGKRFGRGEAARFPEYLSKPAYLAQ